MSVPNWYLGLWVLRRRTFPANTVWSHEGQIVGTVLVVDKRGSDTFHGTLVGRILTELSI